MATYSSYKQISSAQIDSGTITEDLLVPGAGHEYGVQWIYNGRGHACHDCSSAGNCCEQANGRCCLWTVPSGVTRVTFEIWSGGGGAPGHTCCNCCSFSIGGAGGNYGIKTVSTSPGCQYTICAGGSWRCEKSHTCSATMGCRSYVNGFNLSNFCVFGACGGWMCNGDAWGARTFQNSCANCNICADRGADFGMSGSMGWKMGASTCRCTGQTSGSGSAPFVGKMQVAATTEAWCACGCYVNWPAGGGMPGVSSYCGNRAKCCAGGSGQGGSGIVKITFS